METNSEQPAFDLHEFLTLSAQLHQSTILSNGEYHLFKISWPLRLVDDPNRHPDLSALRRRINAHHHIVLLTTSSVPLEASGRMYDIGYVNKAEHPNGQTIALGDDPVPASGLGGVNPQAQYMGCLGPGEWYSICQVEAKRFLDEHDWVYHLDTLNCETFVDRLAERLLTRRPAENGEADPCHAA